MNATCTPRARGSQRRLARVSAFRQLVVLLAAVLVVAACTAASAPQSLDRVGEGVTNGSGAFPTAAPKAAGAPNPPDSNPVAPNAAAAQQIAWTGSLQLQVADLDASIQAARTAIDSLGGFTSASRRSGGDRPVATVTYRIPSARWDEALAALRALAVKVLDEQTDSSDLASQIVDVDARLRNLRASETALQAIASQATRIPDVLEVQARLTEVRGQIEQLAAQQAALADRVALGTLSVTYGTEVVAVTEAARQWDAGREVDAASASLVAFLQQLASAVIWFGIVWLPVLLVAAVVVGVGVLLWRRLRPRIAVLNRPQPTYAWGTGAWPGSQAASPIPAPPAPPATAPSAPPGDEPPDADGERSDRPG